jgi:putative ABC transport system permease protein
MDAFAHELRYATRRLLRSPGFTATVLLTLALGIGANTALFSVVNAILLRPLPYREPERLVSVFHFYPSLNDMEAPVSNRGFRDYRDKTPYFDGLAVSAGWSANLTGSGDPERLQGSRVSGLWFRTLGVAAQIGRTLLPEEDEPGRDKVVVLSDGLWRRLYGGRREAVGERIMLNNEPYEIVGVMPPTFRDFYNRQAQLWKPLALRPDQFAGGYTNEYLNLVARLKAGVSFEQARGGMAAFAEQVKRDNPDQFGPLSQWTLKVRTLTDIATGKIRPALLVLLGAVGFVLLIACANVANLMLARAASRTKEIAIRAALGAKRWHVVRQLLAESMLLALAGGALGLLLAYLGVRALVALNPTNVPRVDELGVDGTVMAFTLGVALLTGLLFGLVPALQVSRADLHETLKEGGRSAVADRTAGGMRRALVVAEVALALTLLIGAGLLIKSVARLQGVDPGFDPRNLVTFGVPLPATKYRNDTTQAAFFTELLPRLAALPGVKGVAMTSVMPFGGSWSTSSFSIVGVQLPQDQPGPWGDYRQVNGEFFGTMRIPLLKGRVFDSRDAMGAPRVAVIDDEAVKRWFKDRDPIGQQIYYGSPTDTANFITIVGVVGHTAHEGLDAERRLQVYLPHTQSTDSYMFIALRTDGDPLRLVGQAREAVRSVDRDQPIANVDTMEQLVEQSVGQRRLSMLLLGLFSAIALLLAAVGIYGVMSYGVAQRSHELGIRMALGAARRDVLGLVLGQGARLAAVGVALGLAGAFGLTRFITSQLYSVSPTDPATFGAVAGALLAAALLATLLPAMRATRVDPVVALREE